MTTLAMGIDVGSLTAKGVLLAEGVSVSSFLCRSLPSATESVEAVAGGLCQAGEIAFEQVSCVCLTGYGRFQAPFPAIEKSEISCHGLGAWMCRPSIRTVVDIGGQDSKVIALDNRGLVSEFAMNNKCAAGTGRALEVLAHALGSDVAALGPLALRGRSGCRLSNRCSLFMENDVLQARRDGVMHADIARAIVEAVVERVMVLTARLPICGDVCLTGGVAKNPGVVAALERHLKMPLIGIDYDPQLVGALGAAHFAARSL